MESFVFKFGKGMLPEEKKRPKDLSIIVLPVISFLIGLCMCKKEVNVLWYQFKYVK